ncbi:MAG: hypothetical protein GY906_10855 [bacterium]|nr:hypothetical protein [bacterium]
METSLEADVRSITAAETSSPSIASLELTIDLTQAGFDPRPLLKKLGIDSQVDAKSLTMGDLIAAFESLPAEARQILKQEATEARVRRLLAAIFLSSGQTPADEAKRWWYELATQILWWYARAQDISLTERGMSTRAAQSLISLGLLDIEVIARNAPEDAATFVDILERLEYSGETATKAYKAIVKVAAKISRDEGGRLQSLLRRHTNQMVEAIGQELLIDTQEAAFLNNAVRGWVSVITSLPISVWSPSTAQFVTKFADAGVTEAMLADAADELGLDLLSADNNFASFVEGVCHDCDPNDETHRYCVKRCATFGFEVECPGRPDLAAAPR